MSTTPVGLMLFAYALLNQRQRFRCFQHLNSESACSEVRNVRIVTCFCNGRLHMQDHLFTFIAQCPAAWQQITLHQLLTHTSGIPMIRNVPNPFPTNPEEVFALFNHIPLDFEPGTQYRYSNEGYQTLGYVIERVSGQSYASFIEQHILAPLHMSDSGFTLPEGQGIAQGYQAWQIKAATTVYDRPLSPDITFLYATGYLYSTVSDLQRWNQALTTSTLISQQSLDAMFTPYVAMPSYSSLYAGSHYGYGWVIDQEGSLRVIWHNGWINGYRAYNGSILIIRPPSLSWITWTPPILSPLQMP